MIANTVQESRAPYGVKSSPHAVEVERRVILHGVSWDTYKALLKDMGNDRSSRLAFDSGELEIMSPLFHHEGSNRPFGIIFFVLSEELGFDYIDAGSVTCNRDDLMKGIEPDSCFYIANVSKIASVENRKSINLDVDPPPDIMIEVDMTSKSMNKLAICEALGVPEHWRYDGQRLEIRVLKNGRYVESESAAFPGLPLQKVLPEMIPLGRKSMLKMSREFRAWVRGQLGARTPSKSAPKKSRKKSV